MPGGFHFLLPVWGESYVDLFLDIVLPSHLAPGNIPGLERKNDSLYRIFTRPQDVTRIEGHPAFQHLSTRMPAIIETIDGEIHDNHIVMSDCYRIGIGKADDADAASVFLTPDMIYADGSFRQMETIAERGYRVIEMTGLRLLKPGVVPELRRFKASKEGPVLTITPRELLRSGMRNLHPITLDHFFEPEQDSDGLVPANLFWRVGQDGILARCFHLHPLMVYPRRKYMPFAGTVDDDLVELSCPDPRDTYWITDSDELLACEISDPAHTVRTAFAKGSVPDIVAWAEYGASRRHRMNVRMSIRLHAGEVDPTAWQEAEARASTVIDAVLGALNQRPLKLLFRRPLVSLRRAIGRMRRDTFYVRSGVAERLEEKHSPLKIAAFGVLLRCHAAYVRIGLGFRSLQNGFARWIVGPGTGDSKWWQIESTYMRGLCRRIREAARTETGNIAWVGWPDDALVDEIDPMGAWDRVSPHLVMSTDSQTGDNGCAGGEYDLVVVRAGRGSALLSHGLRRLLAPEGRLVWVVEGAAVGPDMDAWRVCDKAALASTAGLWSRKMAEKARRWLDGVRMPIFVQLAWALPLWLGLACLGPLFSVLCRLSDQARPDGSAGGATIYMYRPSDEKGAAA